MNSERHHRVMQVFQGALARKGPQREAYLKRACGKDQELRAEVDSLLAFDDPRTITPVRSGGSHPSTDVKLAEDVNGAGRGGAPRQSPDRDRLRASVVALILALLLAALSYWLDSRVNKVLRENLAGQLNATLESNVAAITTWLELQAYEVREWASRQRMSQKFPALVELAQQPGMTLDELRKSQPYEAVLEVVAPLWKRDDVRAVHATDTSGLLVMTSNPKLEHRYTLSPNGKKLIAPVFVGEHVLLPPTRGSSLVEEEIAQNADVPLIIVGSPIRDVNKQVIGGLFAIIESSGDFTNLLDLGRSGVYSDTYAFNQKGQLLSASAYEKNLKDWGLISDSGGSDSVLRVELRDPGVDLTAGYKSKVPISERLPTKMANLATSGFDGMDLDGYRDYRGVKVVGAWKWLEQYGFGVATEIDYDKAYSALSYVRRALWSALGLLVLTSGVAYLSSLSVVRLRREVGVARKLGQYTLEELIGKGGMGKVYKARHALLRRPTAVKVLDGEHADASAVARFEREVQLTSSLTHPNTVEIYDYGRTDDHIFYFAMEYLPGVTLNGLVRREGAIGPARVLYILRQILGSLAEAHGLGLVHRDIKPANIILCERGGEADFVKVVDFGLAKEIAFNSDPQIAQAGLISGTPLYIAPECLGDPGKVSPQSDIYAVGVVTFFLLTGKDLYFGASPLEVFRKVCHEQPPRVSDIIGKNKVPAELEELVFRCVAKDPADRPASVQEMLQVVDSLSKTYVWTQADAQKWWRAFEAEPPQAETR